MIFRLVLRALPHNDPFRALRAALKALSRQHGFQCLRIEEYDDMRVSQAFPSKYLKASAIEGVVRKTIKSVTTNINFDRSGEDWVLIFDDRTEAKLNPTNARNLARDLGDDMEAWAGAQVDIDTVETRMGPGLRMTAVKSSANNGPTVTQLRTSDQKAKRRMIKEREEAAAAALDDEIPY